MKIIAFCFKITEVCSTGSNKLYVIIGPGNGSVQNRQQAITWTNAD